MLIPIALLLFVSSLQDIKSLSFPVYLPVAMILLRLVYLIYTARLLYFLPFCGLLFLIGFCFWKFFNLGIGDAVIMGVMGLCLGEYSLYAVLTAFLLCIPHSIIAGKKEKEYPFTVYLFLGFLFMMIWKGFIFHEGCSLLS